jgi:hypothetical protein
MGAFVMVAIGAGVWRAATGLRSWSRALARLPETRAADLEEGRQVKVVGVIAEGRTVAAPLTQRPCVGFSVRAIGTGRHEAGNVLSGRVLRSGACQFMLRDPDDGTVLVHGERAAMVLADGAAISAARINGVVQREAVLRVGDEVTVVGMVQRELDPGRVSMYREPPTRLVLDGIPLWILSGRR